MSDNPSRAATSSGIVLLAAGLGTSGAAAVLHGDVFRRALDGQGLPALLAALWIPPLPLAIATWSLRRTLQRAYWWVWSASAIAICVSAYSVVATHAFRTAIRVEGLIP